MYEGNMPKMAQGFALGASHMPAVQQPPIDTVSSLLSHAHSKMYDLCEQFGKLTEILGPVRVSCPEEPPEDKNGPLYCGEPECVRLLRALIERIAALESGVRIISGELRI